MAIITISRGSYSKGKDVAEKVAQKLGYQCIAREIILHACKDFNIPEVKLIRAIHDAPSILDKFSYGKERYVAYFQASLLRHLKQDNVVYHGLAGHFFIKGISHALKVRIISDTEDRVRLEMEREKKSREEALRILKKDDEERRKWSLHLYGIDTWDSSLYDLVIHIRKITVDAAVDVICHTVELADFQTTPESQQAMDNLALAADVKAALIGLKQDIAVHANDGMVSVGTKVSLIQEEELVDEIERVARSVTGVKDVKINVRHRVDWSD
jgi:cytidylate kinase